MKTDYFQHMMEAGNKVSSTRFFLIATLAISCILYVIVGFILLWDVLQDGEVGTDLDGLSHFVKSVSINLGIAGFTKIFSGNRIEKEREEEQP